MTSLAAKLAPLARTLVTPEGMPLTFTRTVEGEYDGISNTRAEPSTLTWDAVGMWVKNKDRDATIAASSGTGQLVTRRTLLIPGLGITPMQAGDVVLANGATYTVADVERVADTDGVTVPLYRVQVTA
jgi:hypothetical protein